ncbi:hypothetical protein [Natrinema hispanicum]|uniref:hypothetical protein n=1 Tax=Natrinema hispanicum TaxID=392421 RepID=UPI001A9386BF
MSNERIRWSHKSLDELRSFWNKQIEPDLRHAGHDLDEWPAYQDLLEMGYGASLDSSSQSSRPSKPSSTPAP